MENTAFLQAGLLVATISLLAYCLTLHRVGYFQISAAYALTLMTFIALVCVRYIPGAIIGSLTICFFLLAISGANVAYVNFLSPETDRAKTGSKLAYALGACLLLVVIFWTLDNSKGQQFRHYIEHISGKVDTIAAVAGNNAQRITSIDTTVAKMAKSDTALRQSIDRAKDDLWQKSDEDNAQIKDKLSDLSLQQHRMNTDNQKKR